MNVSPLDLRQQRFRIALRGFDKTEVTSFLMAVSEDYEQALGEADRLRQDVARLEGVVGQYREHERTLQATLMTAQRLADDIRRHADEEAQRILGDAQSRSERMLSDAQSRSESTLSDAQSRSELTLRDAQLRSELTLSEAQSQSALMLEKTQLRLDDVQREIDGLRLKRKGVETSIESTIETLRNTLEYVREQETRDREETVLLHRSRTTELLDAKTAEPQEGRHKAKAR
jgi:cell division initiation protein